MFYYRKGDTIIESHDELPFEPITEEEYISLKPQMNFPPLDMEKLSICDEIGSLKRLLSKSDYKAIKYAEGWISEEEYAPIKAERQALRDRINELEATLQ